ncbi:MAG: hypothetical protein ACWGQW_24515, partial [bacterium]
EEGTRWRYYRGRRLLLSGRQTDASTLTEVAELQKEIEGLQEELEELRRESLTKGRDIEHLKNERLELRSRVQRIRKNIATLEAKESTL